MILRIKRVLDRALESLVIFAVGVLLAGVTWQVFSRFVLRSPSSWTEEFATYLLMWVGLLGAALAVDRGAHLGVDALVLKFPESVRAVLQIIVYVIIAAFAGFVMVGGGIMLIQRTLVTNQILPALRIPMGYVYLCLPISGFFIVFYSVVIIIGRVAAFLPKRNPEQ